MIDFSAGIAPVFGVEEHDIDADSGFACVHDARHFEKHADTASAVVGAVKTLARTVGVLIGEWTRIPVRAKQYAVFGLRIEDADDVFHRDARTVVGGIRRGLHDDRIAEARQFVAEEGCTTRVFRRIGHARSESHLFGHVLKGAVGRKGRVSRQLYFSVRW